MYEYLIYIIAIIIITLVVIVKVLILIDKFTDSYFYLAKYIISTK